MRKQLTFTQSGKPVTYSVEGHGVPVILVHGFGEDRRIWKNQLPFLESFCKTIAVDLPGSGESMIDEQGSIERYAEVIQEVIRQETDEPAIVIGHSMGGYITLALAEKYPDLIKAFALFHSSAYKDDEEKIETRRKGIRFIETHGAAAFLQQATPGLFSERTKTNAPELVDEIIALYANFEPASLVQYYEAMIRRPDRTEVLKAGKPVLFILGTFDSAVPLNKGLEQTHLPDICYIHICKNSGHMGMLEEPDTCNMALKKFITEIS